MPTMPEPPLVSVITIFFNAEKFLKEAIESVRAQTYPRWELLLVDDGSTDSGAAIARRYARRYPGKISYLEHADHQNRGMSASRNLGIRASRGKYVAFLDADDVFLPDKLAKQVAILEQHPRAAMAYGPTLNWHSWTGRINDVLNNSMRSVGVQADRLYQPPELLLRFLDNTAHTPGTGSLLVRREAIETVGCFEERFPGMFEDQAFVYKICLHEPVYVESECRSRYRQHPDSYCNVSRRNGLWDPGKRHPRTRGVFLEWLEEYLRMHEIDDPLIRETLRKERWEYLHPQLHRFFYSIDRLKVSLRM